MPHIFISYRRDDARWVPKILADQIRGAFGADSVFIDIDTVPLGVDFRKHINDAVAQCDVLLAIIGAKWLAKSGDSSKRRIDEPADIVRIELEAALARNIPVIPVLIDNAKMPSPDDLPKTLELLAFRNATELRDGRDMDRDVDELIRALRGHVAPDEKSSKTAATSQPKKGATSLPQTAATSQPKKGATSLPQTEATSQSKGAFNKEWIASYEGNQIRVTNWWTLSGKGEAKLYFNGSCVDTTIQWSQTSLRATVQDQGGSDHIVEVLFGGLLTVKAKISVDGVQIGGDSF